MAITTNLTELVRLAIDRAGTDEAFLEALRQNPEKALQENLGVTFAPSDVISDDELDGVVGGGSMVGGIGGGINVADIKGLDLESAMMAIQSNRANLLEGQLKSQMETIQARNQDLAFMNEFLGAAKVANEGDRAQWDQADKDRLDKFVDANMDKVMKLGLQMETTIDAKGVKDTDLKDPSKLEETLKGKIDALNNSQQMDMLRMQSMTNKRNEAFDLMSSFVQRMQQSRSGIVGTMR